MSNIRVTYTGFISLIVKFSSIFTGLIFTLIITRNLSTEEFGSWALIGSLLIYANVINPIISYWTTREVARGENSAKTAIFSSSILMLVASFVYLLISSLVGIESNLNLDLLWFSVILIPFMFINQILESINLGWKPHGVSVGFLIFEITKIPFAFLFIFIFNMGVYGAILSTIGGYFFSIIFLYIFAKPKIYGNMDLMKFKKWLRLSWLPIYRKAPSMIFFTDTIIFSIITGSLVGVALFTAAKTIGIVVSNTRSFSNAVYPKLLSGGKEKYFHENFIRVFYLSFPIVAITITFAKPALFILNPEFIQAYFLVIILSIRSFLINISNVIFSGLLGIENVDKDEKATFRNYINSKIFKLPTFQIFRDIGYLISLIIIFHLTKDKFTEIDLIGIWALIGLIAEFPIIIYALKLMRDNFNERVEHFTIIKYFFSSIIPFGILYYFIIQDLEFNKNIFEFIPQIIGIIILGIIIYVGITSVIDRRTRILVKYIFTKIRGQS